MLVLRYRYRLIVLVKGVELMKTEWFQLIRDLLTNKVKPSFIIVFGSYAKGLSRRNSDIDIAFYSEDTVLSSYDLFIIAQELAELLKIEVDLIDLRRASTVLKAQIFTNGKVIFADDELLLKKQQMTALRMYAELNEQRKEILNRIEESGCVYEE